MLKKNKVLSFLVVCVLAWAIGLLQPMAALAYNDGAVRGPWPPKTMTVAPESIAREGAVLTVAFDNGYVSSVNDHLLVQALDSNGKIMDGVTVDLYRSANPVQVELKPTASVSAYQIKYVGDKGNENALTKKVTVAGEAAQPGFDVPVGLKIDYGRTTLQAGASVSAPKINLVDKNGKTMPVSNVAIAVAGDALEPDSARFDGSFKVKSDAKGESVVAVTAVSGRFHASVSLKVESKQVLPSTLSKPTEVVKDVATDVVLQMQEDGKNVAYSKLVKEVAVQVSGASAEATVVDASKLVSDGQVTVRVTGKEVGKAVLTVSVTEADGQVNTLVPATIQVRESKAPSEEKRNVTMRINERQMIIDGDKVTMDTVPVIQNNRTFVPFRALAQAFGAKVTFDEATQRIIAELGGKTIVMTIGSNRYTIDGQARLMDVAPYIDINNRTMVPVRFVAHAMGFTVTPIYDAQGVTRSVLFSNGIQAAG